MTSKLDQLYSDGGTSKLAALFPERGLPKPTLASQVSRPSKLDQLYSDGSPSKIDRRDPEDEWYEDTKVKAESTYSPESPAAGGLNTPFLLSVAGSAGAGFTWSVSSAYSSITDDTNGGRIDLSALGIFDVPNAIAASAFIVLEADVDAAFVVSNWALSAVADPSEVAVDAGPPAFQNKVRLLIGRVVFTAGEAEAKQAVFTPQMLSYGFYNGLLVKLFTAAPVNKDDL